MKKTVPMTENVEAVKAEEALKAEEAAKTEEAAAAEETAQASEAKAEEPNPLERSVEVTLDQAQFDSSVKAELRRIGKNLKMPGFRPGHVPAKMVEAAYGFDAANRVMNRMIDEQFREAVKQGNYNVAGQANAAPVEGEAMKFKLTFEVLPEITTPDLSALELKRYTCEVTEEAVQKTIDIIVRQRATYEVEEGRKAAADDKVTVNFEGSRDGEPFEGGSAEDFQFLLGQGRMLPEFETAVTGMSAGESKTFDLTFPANYGNADLAGKQVSFKVDCTKVEKPVYPAVDDDFAKTLGLESVEKMREEIKKNLEREVKERLSMRTRQEVMEALYKLCDFPVPQVMLEAEMKAVAENFLQYAGSKGKAEDLPRELLFEPANRQLHLAMLTQHILQENNIVASKSEIEARAREIASAYEEPEEMVKWVMSNQQQFQGVAGRVLEEKLVDFVLGKAKTTDEAVPFDDLMGRSTAAA